MSDDRRRRGPDGEVIVDLVELTELLHRDHPGVIADDEQRSRNVAAGAALCGRCDGTGNELFAMYRRCTGCDGTGRLTSTDDVN